MSAITTAITRSVAPAPLRHVFAAMAEAAAFLARRIAAAWRHRHDAAVLAGMDDRLLADIGLTRADLNDAIAEPLWRDPTAVLARRHGERRRLSRNAIDDLIRRHASPPLAPGADAFRYPPSDPPARLTL